MIYIVGICASCVKNEGCKVYGDLVVMKPTRAPTTYPTLTPSPAPTTFPTVAPTKSPTSPLPTVTPTKSPTMAYVLWLQKLRASAKWRKEHATTAPTKAPTQKSTAVSHIERDFQGTKFDNQFIAAAIGNDNIDPKELNWATKPTPQPTPKPTLSEKVRH